MKPSDEFALTPDLIDAYLDGTLDDATRRRLDALWSDASSAEGARLREAMRLQTELDERLLQAFVIPPIPLLDFSQAVSAQSANVDSPGLDQPASDVVPSPDSSSEYSSHRFTPQNGAKHKLSGPPSRRRTMPETSERWQRLAERLSQIPNAWKIVALLALATAAWLLVARNFWPQDGKAVFRDRPLEEVYRETVDLGFEPRYIVDEPDRFRDTFYFRHGQPIKLAELPMDREMLGLSYLSGVSRHSTAMLARVEGQPVIVFIDRLDRDRPMEAPSSRSGLHMFRRELENVVMYEITPFDSPGMFDYLMPTDPPPDDCLEE